MKSVIYLVAIAGFAVMGMVIGGVVYLISAFVTSGIPFPSCASLACFETAYAAAGVFLTIGAGGGAVGGAYTAYRFDWDAGDS